MRERVKKILNARIVEIDKKLKGRNYAADSDKYKKYRFQIDFSNPDLRFGCGEEGKKRGSLVIKVDAWLLVIQ